MYTFMNTDMNQYLIFRKFMGMLINSCKKNDSPSAESLVLGKLARHLCLQSTFLVYLFIYMVRWTSVSARASNRKEGGVKCQSFLKQKPLETDTKNYFQRKRVLPVSRSCLYVYSKGSLRSTERESLQALAVL